MPRPRLIPCDCYLLWATGRVAKEFPAAASASTPVNGGKRAVHLPLAGNTPVLCYDGTIMMARTQITLEPEQQRRARQRASDLGISLAEYLRRLVTRDLDRPPVLGDVALVFDLGRSGSSAMAQDQGAGIAEAFHSAAKNDRSR